jgi:hypothetical protein
MNIEYYHLHVTKHVNRRPKALYLWRREDEKQNLGHLEMKRRARRVVKFRKVEV